ncbi:MAG: glycosyltransferase [Oceanospirillaceae bacterium]
MKITFIAFTSTRGGAAKALTRVKNLLHNLGCETALVSIEDNENRMPIYFKAMHYIVWVLSHLITKLQRNDNASKHSLNIFGSHYIKREVKRAKLLHIHWINNETLSIKDFVLFSNKSVITLHDEWFYCGAEHYALDDSSYARVVAGYTKNNKNVKGIDINRLIWQCKKKYYSSLNGVIFTVPSTWMKRRAEKSDLLRDKDIRVVPNPINTDVFRSDKTNCSIDGIEPEDFVITFGAIDGGASGIKGFDLLTEAVQVFSESVDSLTKIKIITFGGKQKTSSTMFGIKTIELGHISSEKELAHIYSLSSVTIVPSRAESFGQVAAESLACETPVIAFNYSGLTDIVKHKDNGYLAEPFDPHSLANGLLWFYSLSNDEKAHAGISGRNHVLKVFSEEVIGEQLISIYKELGYTDN